MSVNRRDFLLGTAVGAGALALPVGTAAADVEPAGGLRVESTAVEYAAHSARLYWPKSRGRWGNQFTGTST